MVGALHTSYHKEGVIKNLASYLDERMDSRKEMDYS